MTVKEIDIAIRLNYYLVADGPHPAVDYYAVWKNIDRLLELRYKIESSGTGETLHKISGVVAPPTIPR